MEEEAARFIDFFKQIPDHRMDRKKLHPVEEILLITFCGVISGCDSWEDLELYGKIKLDVLCNQMDCRRTWRMLIKLACKIAKICSFQFKRAKLIQLLE